MKIHICKDRETVDCSSFYFHTDEISISEDALQTLHYKHPRKYCDCCGMALDDLYTYIIAELIKKELLQDDYTNLCCTCNRMATTKNFNFQVKGDFLIIFFRTDGSGDSFYLRRNLLFQDDSKVGDEKLKFLRLNLYRFKR